MRARSLYAGAHGADALAGAFVAADMLAAGAKIVLRKRVRLGPADVLKGPAGAARCPRYDGGTRRA